MHTSHPFLKKKKPRLLMLDNIPKTQSSLAILKAQASYLALFYKKTQSYQYLAKYYIISISLKVQ